MNMSPEIPISFTVVMVFVFLFVGFFAGRAVTLLSKRKKDSETPSQPTPVAEKSIQHTERHPPLADPEKYTELVRLWREKKGPGLFVETSGHLLASSAPLNPAQKKRFIDLIKELAVWLEIDSNGLLPQKPEILEETEKERTVKAEPEIKTEQAPSRVKASIPVNTDPIPSEKPLPTPPPAPVTPTIPVQAQVPPVVPVYAPTAPTVPPAPPASAAADKPKKQATTMVEQVDEILQELIARSDNPNRHIKLMEEKNDGVIVWVGQERFVGIDSITDESAVSLVRAAAKEWERRTEIRPTTP